MRRLHASWKLWYNGGLNTKLESQDGERLLDFKGSEGNVVTKGKSSKWILICAIRMLKSSLTSSCIIHLHFYCD